MFYHGWCHRVKKYFAQHFPYFTRGRITSSPKKHQDIFFTLPPPSWFTHSDEFCHQGCLNLNFLEENIPSTVKSNQRVVAIAVNYKSFIQHPARKIPSSLLVTLDGNIQIKTVVRFILWSLRPSSKMSWVFVGKSPSVENAFFPSLHGSPSYKPQFCQNWWCWQLKRTKKREEAQSKFWYWNKMLLLK